MSSGVAESCPRCSEPRIGLFCEQCGHSFSVAASPALPSWCAVIAPDRDYYAAGGAEAERFSFPLSCQSRRLGLTGAVVRVGRDGGSRPHRAVPEIALADPGVSREHARLLAQPDGTWAVIDDGSTNGTYLNRARHRLPAHHPIPLANADRIHLGVWTTITILASHSAG